MDSIPYDIAVNPNTNNIYLANFESKSIFVLNGDTDNLTSVQSFYVYPNEAGKIRCGGIERPVNVSIRLDNQTACEAFTEFRFQV